MTEERAFTAEIEDLAWIIHRACGCSMGPEGGYCLPDREDYDAAIKAVMAGFRRSSTFKETALTDDTPGQRLTAANAALERLADQAWHAAGTTEGREAVHEDRSVVLAGLAARLEGPTDNELRAVLVAEFGIDCLISRHRDDWTCEQAGVARRFRCAPCRLSLVLAEHAPTEGPTPRWSAWPEWACPKSDVPLRRFEPGVFVCNDDRLCGPCGCTPGDQGDCWCLRPDGAETTVAATWPASSPTEGPTRQAGAQVLRDAADDLLVYLGDDYDLAAEYLRTRADGLVANTEDGV